MVMDVTLQVSGKSGRSEVRVGAHLLMVVDTEGNDVVVGGQNPPTPDFACPGLRLTLQNGLDLLRNDRATENAGEGVADRRLELSFEAADKAHVTDLARRSSGPVRWPCVSPGLDVSTHGRGP
jgi:hypothetical protein